MSSFDDHPYTTQDSSSQWYVDYRCKKCGQLGTARFSGNYINEDDIRSGFFGPVKSIFCCECKSDQIVLVGICCYQFHEELERSKTLNEAIARVARSYCIDKKTVIDPEEKMRKFAEYLSYNENGSVAEILRRL
jgi:hypothetical protein